VHIQVLVVKTIFDLLLDQGPQIGQIHDKTRIRIHLPPDPHLELKIVPMETRGVALAKNRQVALGAPVRIVQPMGRIEMCFSANGRDHGTKELKKWGTEKNSALKYWGESHNYGPWP